MNATILMISKVILTIAILGPVLDWLFRDYPGWALLIVFIAVAVRYIFWIQSKFKKTDDNFVEIDKKFLVVDHRFETVEGKVDVLTERVSGLENKIEKLETKMDKRFDRVEKHLNRITRLPSKKLRRKFRTSS